MHLKPFDIDQALDRIEKAVAPYPKAAMFELADEGFSSPFEQLIACIISIRTKDEVSLVCARALFELARTPAEMVRLTAAEIDAAISQSTYHESKSHQILAIAREIEADHNGELPCDYDTMTGFRGVGPKCANLALGIACGERVISVDIHVHRITNRWGYVSAGTPEKTLAALEKKLPQRHWVDINRLLVPFGKHVCTGRRPKCSTCPVVTMCRQVGVENPR